MRCTRRAAIAGLVASAATGCRRGEPAPLAARFALFATRVDVTLWHDDRRAAERALAALQALYARLDRDWYAWGSGALARLNATLAQRAEAELDDELARLLRSAFELSERSGGRFDPRVGSLIELWGFHDATAPAAAALPADDHIAAARRRAAQTVTVSRTAKGWALQAAGTGVVLDVGGVAKGALLASGLALVARHGVHRALIDAGGDIAGLDARGGAPFRIGIRPARRGGAVRALALRPGEAVATSGDYARYRTIGGERYAHIVDPRTGRPGREARSATVVAGDAMLADAAATALIVGGRAEFVEICDAMSVELALLIDNRGEVTATEPMRSRLDRASLVPNQT